jgi:hypothetical protein
MEINGFINTSGLTYCGTEAREIFSKEIYNLDLFGYGIRLMDGVKGKRKIYNGEVGDLWQEYSCPFTPQGEVRLSEDFIEPAEIKVNLEECFDTFWDNYMVEQTRISLNGGIPQTFYDWFFNDVLVKKMDKEYQEIFWKGDTEYSGTSKAYLSVTDGVEKKLSDDAMAGTAFTVSNILAQVESVVMAGLGKAGENEADTEGYKIFMNVSDVRLLTVALGNVVNGNSVSAIFSNYAKEGEKIYIYGFEVVPTMQSKNSVIFGPASNLVLGFDTADSHVQYKIIDLRDSTGDNAFRVIAISNIAVGVVFPELFVMLKA